MTMLPCWGVSDLSTISKSPSWMPAPTIESPRTRKKNVASGRATRCSSKDSLPST